MHNLVTDTGDTVDNGDATTAGGDTIQQAIEQPKFPLPLQQR